MTRTFVTDADQSGIDDTDVSKSETQYYLDWTDDCTITFTGTIYIYVTLQFPDNVGTAGTEWTEFSTQYAAGNLTNTFHVMQLNDAAYHDVEVTTSAFLQKGVYDTGLLNLLNGCMSDTDSDGLVTYVNKSSGLNGYVAYYVAVFNDGPNNLYLNDLQDVLPEGFTYYDGTGSKLSAASSATAAVITDGDEDGDGDPDSVTYKTFTVSVQIDEETTALGKTQQKLTFTLSNSASGDDLALDTDIDKYYLEPNEAAVFVYYVCTNDYTDTKDDANNVVAMPFYDYTGGGVKAAEDVTITSSASAAGQTANDDTDSTDMVQGIGMASSSGMDIESGENQWLFSNVAVHRNKIIPGITKSTQTTSVSTYESVTWQIEITNTGDTAMTDYTITDVMQKPYTFSGGQQGEDTTVSYTINYGDRYLYDGSGLATVTLELFTISGTRGENESGQETVTLTYLEDYAEKTETLIIGGDPVTLTEKRNVNDGGSTGVMDFDIQVAIFKDSEGNEVLSIRFVDDGTTIVSGGSGVLTLTTVAGSDSENRVYINTAYLTPSQDFTFDSGVTQGSYTDSTDYARFYDDTSKSVYSEAQITASYGFATSSVKSVVEDSTKNDSDPNEAYSNQTKRYITLSSEDSTFTYTLSVTNETVESAAMSSLILIDNLPDVGDHNTFISTSSRSSEFRVDFADADSFKVEVTLANGTVNTLTAGTDYTIEFSTKTEFDSTDWDGSSTDWYTADQLGASGSGTALSDMRSFRIVFNFDNDDYDAEQFLIPAGATVTVSFQAEVSDTQDDLDGDGTIEGKEEISGAAIAWNSFGYHYTVYTGSGTSSEALESAPLKVGVQVPSAPKMIKQLQTADGTADEAHTAETFRFVIYETTLDNNGLSTITLDSWTTWDELVEALDTAGITSFGVADVTVSAGESASDAQSLKGNVKVYTIDNSSGTPTAAEDTGQSWTWEDDQAYTIVESGSLSSDSKYTYASFNASTNTNSYTFTYDREVTLTLTWTNQRQVWDFHVVKTNAEATNFSLPEGSVYLPGAVFALYSEDPSDQMTAAAIQEAVEEIQAAKATTKLTESSFDISKVVGDTTWYLMDIAFTGSSGVLSWSGFDVSEGYLLEEVEAPANYSIGSVNMWHVTTSSVSTVADDGTETDVTDSASMTGTTTITVEIKIANVLNQYELPLTGGLGTNLYTMTGLLFLLGAACLMYKKLRRRREDI